MSQPTPLSQTSFAGNAIQRPAAGLSESQAAQWIAAVSSRLAQAQAQARGTAFAIEGHNSKAFYGEPVGDGQARLSTSDYAGVVSYDPTELVVVARSGTAITELENMLAQEGQRLALSPLGLRVRVRWAEWLRPACQDPEGFRQVPVETLFWV